MNIYLISRLRVSSGLCSLLIWYTEYRYLWILICCSCNRLLVLLSDFSSQHGKEMILLMSSGGKLEETWRELGNNCIIYIYIPLDWTSEIKHIINYLQTKILLSYNIFNTTLSFSKCVLASDHLNLPIISCTWSGSYCSDQYAWQMPLSKFWIIIFSEKFKSFSTTFKDLSS